MTAARAHVLVVEDEELTRTLLVAFLESEGFQVSQAWDGPTSRAAFAGPPIDLALLDIELPGEDGFSLLAHLRERSRAAVIFLTRRGAIDDRVRGLDLGADDYIVKPPDLRELLARIRSSLRRGRAPESGVPLGAWTFHAARRCVTDAAGTPVPLSPGEVAILETVVAARGEIVSRETLCEALERAGVAGRSLDVLIHRLRAKLGEGGNVPPRILVSVYGAGYRVGEPTG